MHGIPKFSTLTHNEVCGGRMTIKQTKQEIPKFVAIQMTIQNALIHSLCGPLPYTFLSSSRYFITFTNDMN
jgi:hypothetical protein